MQRSVRLAWQPAGLVSPVSLRTLRHVFATHPLAGSHDIRTVQALLGDSDVSTIMLYTHVITRGGQGAPNPLDV